MNMLLSKLYQSGCNAVDSSFDFFFAHFYFYEGLACDFLIQLDIAFRNFSNLFVCHFGRLLALFALKTILHKPFAYEFLGQLALGLTLFLQPVISVCIEIAGRIGGMNLINQINLTIDFTKFILGVNQNQTSLLGHFPTALKKRLGNAFQLNIFCLGYQAARYNFFSGDILIMPLHSFGRRRDYRLREEVIFFKPVRHAHPTKHTPARLIYTPCMARKVATNYHFYGKGLTLSTNGNMGQRVTVANPVRNYIFSSL